MIPFWTSSKSSGGACFTGRVSGSLRSMASHEVVRKKHWEHANSFLSANETAVPLAPILLHYHILPAAKRVSTAYDTLPRRLDICRAAHIPGAFPRGDTVS